MKQLTFALIAGFSLVTITGCGGGPSKPPELPTVKATAKLTVDGKPFGPGVLSLSPETSDKNIPNSTGTVKDDGSVTLWTYKDKEGVVPGKYSVQLQPDPMKIGTAPHTKPVSIEIKEGASIDISLETDKKAKSGAPL